MKKLLTLALVLCVMLTAASCGKNAEESAESTASPSVSASSSPSETTAASSQAATPAASVSSETSASNEKASPEPQIDGEPASEVGEETEIIERETEIAEGEINETKTEHNFSGSWIASETTSTNEYLSSVELEITYTGYTVTMIFSGKYQNTTYEGTYEIKDGVLIFDDNFEDCTAYFYDDDNTKLILDNGTSKIVMVHRETEEDMLE